MQFLLNIKNVKIYIKIVYSFLHVSVHADHPQGAYTEPG
jgi:hypothetical protein